MKKFLLKHTKPKFWFLNQHIKKGFNIKHILDVGIQNNSICELRLLTSKSTLHGLDLVYSDASKLCDHFYCTDLNINTFETKQKFDFIIVNHVLEHLHDPTTAVCNFIKCASDETAIFLEFPNINALKHKQRLIGYHFHDDDTHFQVPNEIEIINLLLQNNFKIAHAGTFFKLRKFILGIVRIPFYALTGKSLNGLFAASSGKITTIFAYRSRIHYKN